MIRESDGEEVFLINGKYLTDEETWEVAIKMVKDISTGLPQHISINDVDNEKMSSSEKRFLQHYIGMKKSAWHKRQKKSERLRKNKISNFDGALNSFGLAYFVTEPKPDKDLKFSKKMEDIEIRVGITKKGIEFLMLENEILDEWEGEWYPSNWPRSISINESKFFATITNLIT